jgi:hypothetical protein
MKSLWINNFYKYNIVKNWIYLKKIFLRCLFICFFLIWLSKPIKLLFDDFIVKKYLSWFLDFPINTASLIIYISIILSFFNILSKNIYRTKYKINPYLLICFSVLVFLYFLERTLWQNYDHLILGMNFWLFENLKILDPIALLLSISIFILLKNLFKWSFREEVNSWMEIDSPIEDQEKDTLNRNLEVENLTNLVNSLPNRPDSSHVIGIVGTWGYGKTSFLGMLKNRLKDESIIIEFNPWIFSNTSNLVEDFFISIERKVSKYIQTKNIIINYGKTLSNLAHDSKSISRIKEFIFPARPLKNQYSEISKLVKNLEKKTIILIDDLDRLDNSELFEVMRLIRNTANFPNFIFILAYDKKYLKHALTNLKIYNSDKYLDKIIHFEIALPWISSFKIIQYLTNLLNSKIDLIFELNPLIQSEFKSQLKDILLEWDLFETRKPKYSTGKEVTKIFSNIRDITRFSNSFIFYLQNYYDKIYLPDLFILELIKFLDISLISRLAFNDYLIIQSDDGVGYFKLYTNEDQHNQNSDIIFVKPSKTIETVLKDYSNADLTNNLVFELFSLPEKNDFNSEFSICYFENFDFYFSLFLNEDKVSFDYIKNLIQDNEIQ